MIRPPLLFATAACVAACSAVVAEEPPQRTWRPYAQGPLQAEDFQGTPKPDKKTMQAETVTEILYDYRYKGRKENGKFRLGLSRITFTAVVHRDRSWNRTPRDARLMDHEQGHFDITELSARQAQRLFDQLIDRGSLVGTGPTQQEADQDLVRRIEETVRPILDSHNKDQKLYDQVTRHGVNRFAQREARRRQQQQLAATAPEKEAEQEGE